MTEDLGDVIFSVENRGEVLKITPDGDFYVKGNLVTNDKQVYGAFIEFLMAGGYYDEEEDDGTGTEE